MNYYELSLELHEKHTGKISVSSKVDLNNRDDLSIAYTPGVSEPCRKIHSNPDDVYKYTAKSKLVAIVSDASAVLGLGNIGPAAAIPVMEGKAILFKAFGDVDGFPICLDTQDPDEIVNAVKMIAPVFGGINLEDICAPKCFDIEARLKKELDIPVFHDDQHGTAIVVTAALINALKLTGKKIEDVRIVLNGPGAAGTAIINMLVSVGASHIIACDTAGILYNGRTVKMSPHKQRLCEITNTECLRGDLSEAVKGADVFIGVSTADVLTPEMVETMNDEPIVFAMANPSPEISYENAMNSKIRIFGTGRSDYPNQINNVLAFPGVFKGALSVRASEINDTMKIAAANAIAAVVSDAELREDYVIPGAFDARVADAVSQAVASAAVATGVARV